MLSILMTIWSAFVGSKILRIAVVLGLTFIAGVYSGNTLTVKYYKWKEIAALNEKIKKNEELIKWQNTEIANLQKSGLQLQDDLESLKQNAEQDTNANNPSLSVDGVRRLNKIR